jgi:hypothetical protein
MLPPRSSVTIRPGNGRGHVTAPTSSDASGVPHAKRGATACPSK